jgi:hypothetical protein
MITHPVDAIDAQEWSPAHQAPDVEREATEGLLTEKSLVMLFPTPAPVADPEATEARFTAHTYLPDDRSSASLRVEWTDRGLNFEGVRGGSELRPTRAG